ncbi:MAG: hypothetical protein ACJ79R_08460 [Anaeromyxobacteraceae bacterium]
MHRTIRVAAVGLALTASAAARAQQSPAQPQQHVRGDVVALSGDTLEVKSRAGQDLKLKLAADAKVASVEKADLGSIGEGVFVGTTAVPQQDGTLRAVEVHLFPDAMRGTGEGHRPWDLQPGSTMTNATVAKVQARGGGKPAKQSTMTNATVAKVSDAGGSKTLQLKYKDGEKTVVVPPGTPVVKMAPADRSRLTPGAHVFAIVTRQPDGALVAQRLTVGQGDTVPPM